MNRKTVKTAFSLEIKRLLFGIAPYIYFGAMTLIAAFYTVYLNFYSAIPDLQYTLRYLPLPIMLLLPFVTAGAFADKRGSDRMLISLGADYASLLLGRLLALCAVSVSPVLPMLALPPVIGSLGSISYTGAYLGLLSITLFSVAYCSALTLISAACGSKRLCYLISYAFFLAVYLGDMVHAALPVKALPMTLVAVTLSALISLSIFAFTRRATAPLTVFSAITVVFCVLCNAFKSLAHKVMTAILALIIPTAPIGELLNGSLLDARYILYPLLFTALCFTAAYLCLEGRRQDLKEGK